MRAATTVTSVVVLALLGCEPEPTCSAQVVDACPEQVPSYAQTVQPVLERSCVSCHGPGGEKASVPLTSWELVHRRASSMQRQLLSCRMPRGEGPPLSDEERQVVLAWLVCGAPDS